MKELLPDSRPRELKGAVFNHATQSYWRPVFCANCGASGGHVPEENMTFAFYICNSCYEKHGAIAGTLAMPDEVFWDEIREEHLNRQQKQKGE